MTSAELYELVKGHEDVWGETLRYAVILDNPVFFQVGWSNAESPRAVELMLIALFALATECGVRGYEYGQLGNKSFTAYKWAGGSAGPFGHGLTPLAAIVNVREAMGKGNKETFNG